MAFKGDKNKVGLYLSGQQVVIPDTNIFITQPTIKQIVSFGEDIFSTGIGFLSNTKNLLKILKSGNSELIIYPDFQLLMIVLEENQSISFLISEIFELIFPNYDIKLNKASFDFYLKDEELNESILVGQINPYNFKFFQTLLNDLFIFHIEDETERDFNPANDAAATIAKKLQKGREKRAQAQGPQSVFGIYCSVLSIGLKMDINVFFNYTPFQLYDSYIRFFEKQKSDFYMRVSTMPFMDVSKMDTPKE